MRKHLNKVRISEENKFVQIVRGIQGKGEERLFGERSDCSHEWM